MNTEHVQVRSQEEFDRYVQEHGWPPREGAPTLILDGKVTLGEEPAPPPSKEHNDGMNRAQRRAAQSRKRGPSRGSRQSGWSRGRPRGSR